MAYTIESGVKRAKTKIAIALSSIGLLLGGGGLSLAVLSTAQADSLPAIDFEAPTYAVGNIDGQNGWTKTGPYDVAVDSVSSFSDASGYGFGDQALRLSNAVTSGSFGDQTFSPGLTDPAGESAAQKHFESSFDIGSTNSEQQPGLFLSVSPDDGNGSRMSYVGFDDLANGIHVIFYDATDAGPLGTAATFNESDVATIDRASAHTIKFSIDLMPGPANDVVDLYVDGTLVHTGTTWEDYYRYDPEQTGNGNVVPEISKLLFREGGTAAPGTQDNGYLVDNVSLESGMIVNEPTSKQDCKHGGWMNLTDAQGNPFENQGQCVAYVNGGGTHNRVKITNNNNISVVNVSSQHAKSGKVVVKGNTTSGNASSGNARNNNSAGFNIVVSNF
jgi:hypothetical protein